jgi:hypothetical protein
MENNSPDWDVAKRRYETEDLSVRGLAKQLGISHTALLKRAKAGGWSKFVSKPTKRKPVVAAVETTSERLAKEMAFTSVPDLARRGRGIIQGLMAELEAAGDNVPRLLDLVEGEFDGEKDGKRRAQLERILTFESRARTANFLATALAKLVDAAPGKKQQAEDAAAEAGKGSDWGDDLDPLMPRGRVN